MAATKKPKTCSNRTKCTGFKKDGTLKKGYRFVKGGKIVKTKTK
jgi:hypothetical protein